MSPAAPAGRPPERLTVDAIVDAAAEMVAAGGFDGLSMRKLAKACGVGVMTLYGYVATKDDLLRALADRFLADLDLPAAHEGDWAYRVATVFHSVRRAFLLHPDLLPIVAAHHVVGLSTVRGAEVVFAALREAGLDDAEIIDAFSALTSFTVGACQREIGLTRRVAGARPTLPGIGELAGGGFDHVVAMTGRLPSRDVDAEFTAGLDLLLTGIRGWLDGA